MIINFKKIRVTNFLSVGNKTQTLEFNQGKTLIYGLNGTGKSTIPLDALIFALYGTSFRKANKPQLANWFNKKGCVVQLEFEVNGKDYLVTRGIAPTVFTVHVDQKEVDTHAGGLELQDWFESTVLRMSVQTFKQICVLGSADYTPFMKLTASQRREVSEQLTSTTVISIMNRNLKERIALYQTDIALTHGLFDMAKSNMKSLRSFVQADIELKKDQRRQIFEQGIVKSTERKSLIDSIASMRLSVAAFDDVLEAKKTVTHSITLHEIAKTSAYEQIEFVKTQDSCPYCFQNIDDDHTGHVIESKLSKIDILENDIAKLKLTDDELHKEVLRFEVIKNGIKQKEDELTKVSAELLSLVQRTTTLDKEIAALEATEITSDHLVEAQGQIDHLEMKLNTLYAEQKVNEAALKLLKDNAIKATIIKQYIPLLNLSIAKYLQAFEFFARFEFDENFDDKISGGSKDFSYNNLSMGQRQRVDLAMLFAWRDVARQKSNADTNLIVFDEILDMSLDGDGIDSLLGIIDQLTKGTATVIISHRESLVDKVNCAIKVTKVDGFTELTQA